MEISSRTTLGCYVSGFLFALGWWLFIDAAAYAAHNNLTISVNFVKTLPGIGVTIALFAINIMDWEAVTADANTYHNGEAVACRARSFVMLMLLGALGSLIGSIVILAEEYVDSDLDESVWPGVAIFLQTFLIFFATFVMKVFTAGA